jgi:multiple sugar transport system ATP-binding protein
MSSIELKGLGKKYATNGPWTIKNADLQIDPGEFCVFVGPSGCGKSTLLRMLAGLEAISTGDLLIDGERVNEIAPAKRGVAMVFQSYALYPHMSVFENMAFGLRVLGSDKAAIEKKVRRAAEILQLTPLLDRLPKALSGGQRQRVAIGRAIVKEPRVFLFDEPLSNLDAALRVQTRLEIAKLHRDLGSASMVYVTHDQVEAMTLAEKIVLLNTGNRIEEEGSIAQIGSPMDLYHRPASVFVAEFIGSPKMNLLHATLLQAERDYASVSIQGQTLKVAVDAQHLRSEQQVQIGIRPENVLLAHEDAEAHLCGTLSHVERLGDVSLLYVDLLPDAPAFTVRVEGETPAMPGHKIRLRLPPDSMHLFDASGKASRRTVNLPH